MIKTLQRKLPIVMALCLICTLFSFTTTFANDITPYYNNVSYVTSNVNIDDDGLMDISYRYSGNSTSTSKAVITTYIEKKFLLFFGHALILEPIIMNGLIPSIITHIQVLVV